MIIILILAKMPTLQCKRDVQLSICKCNFIYCLSCWNINIDLSLYTDKEFDELPNNSLRIGRILVCFQFGVELDEVVYII